MKIRLLKKANVQVEAGTVIDVDDRRAEALLRAGLAVKAGEKTVEKAVKAPAETAEKKTRKK